MHRGLPPPTEWGLPSGATSGQHPCSPVPAGNCAGRSAPAHWEQRRRAEAIPNVLAARTSGLAPDLSFPHQASRRVTEQHAVEAQAPGGPVAPVCWKHKESGRWPPFLCTSFVPACKHRQDRVRRPTGVQPGTPPASGRVTAERSGGTRAAAKCCCPPAACCPCQAHDMVRHTGLQRQASLLVTRTVYKVALSRKARNASPTRTNGDSVSKKSASSACKLSSTEYGK